jgi:polyisoprenoid-binding protein YceI
VDIKTLINSRIPLLVGGKVPVDISTSVGSMNVNAFPTANLGQQPVANSLSVTPASDIADPTYIGDIRFGEALPVGDNVIGKVKIDQAIPGTTNLVNVNGGPSQTADIKVTLDSETIAVTGPLTDAQLSAQSLAKDSSLTNILNKIIAEPSTAAKQDLIITALGLIATEATTGDIKTAVEALAALISAGALAVSLTELPDTAAGDLADINTASASIDGKLPAIGQQLKAASLSIVPASDADDVKVTLDSESVAVTGPLTDAELRASDIKVTLDSESVAVTGPLTDAQLTTQALAKESTLGSVKTAVEALAGATPDTVAGDLAAINSASASIDGKLPALVDGKIPVDVSVSIDSVDIGDVDIKEFPAGNLGQQLKAASLSVAPATDIVDATYIGDIKFGEELPAGTQLIGKIGIDQTTPGTTNLVNVNGGASQTADIKVTLDSESVAVTGPLTNAELTAQALATEATLGTMKADIALMKTDLAAILAILES